MRRRRRNRRIWLLPLVVAVVAGIVFFAPNAAQSLPQSPTVGKVVDATTGKPVAGATIQFSGKSVQTDADGTYQIAAGERPPSVMVTANGYAPTESSGDLVKLRSTVVAGGVFDPSGRPIAGAIVASGKSSSRTSKEGIYRLEGVPAGSTIVVKAPGFGRAEGTVERSGRLDLRLQPQAVRAAYISAAVLSVDELRENLLQTVEGSELNALVIDLKGDRGELTYLSRVPLARQIGATPKFEPGLATTIARLKRNNIYTIARIVTFKDRLLATARPDLAVKDRTSGRPFVDLEGQFWVDPFAKDVWDYNLALAEEAAALGFDEVQFDYIRFPSDGKVDNVVYSKPSTAESRSAAIRDFLTQAADRLRPTGVFLAVDIFGYVVWTDGELGIGQQVEQIVEVVDYISPMLYPSTFGAGIPGFSDRNAAITNPYEVIKRSIDVAAKRTKGEPVRIRPWFQYFDDYSWQTGKRYGDYEVNEQKRGATDAGVVSWMLWDPTNTYSRGGFNRKN